VQLFADTIATLPFDDMAILFKILPLEKQAELFTDLSESLQHRIIEALETEHVADIMEHLAADEAVDTLQSLPEDEQAEIMSEIDVNDREEIRMLSQYEEGEVGAVMTPDCITLSQHLKILEVLEIIRVTAKEQETIYYCYVLDDNKKLVGCASLKEIFLSDPNVYLKDIMKYNDISINSHTDQEKAANLIYKYDLLALPITDKYNRILGILTYDDALGVVKQEQTEDIEKLMAIGGEHKYAAYLSTSTWNHVKSRGPWVIVLAMFGLMTGTILHSYEDVLEAFIILALYMSMIADAGGTVGSQSGTMVIKALVTGEVTFRDVFKVLFKEFKISCWLAVALGILAFLKVLFLSHASTVPMASSLFMIASVISIALVLQVVTSTMIGAVLPLADKCKIDPAVVASPVLTTIVDITEVITEVINLL